MLLMLLISAAYFLWIQIPQMASFDYVHGLFSYKQSTRGVCTATMKIQPCQIIIKLI